MKKPLLALAAVFMLLSLAALALFYDPELTLAEVRQKQAQPDSRFITVGGISAHYKVQGQGPALLLLHGSQGNLSEFTQLAALLSPHFRVYSLDLPGHGLSEDPLKLDYSRASFMAFLDDFLHQLNIDKVHLLGHSFSGYLSLHYALLHPEKVGKLILLNAYGGICAGRDYRPQPLVEELPGMASISRYLLPKFLVQEELANNYLTPPPTDYVQGVFNILKIPGRRMYTKHLRQFQSDFARSIDGEAHIQAEKLILSADLDHIHDRCEAENLKQRLSHSRLVPIANAKHGAHMDQPAAVSQAVLEFLQ